MGNVGRFLEQGLALRVQAPFYHYEANTGLIVQLYQQNAGVIDFLLFFILFTGIAKFTLQKQFSGAGGSMLSLAIGLILSFSLVLTQEYIGFRLMNFGPYAAFLVMFLVGIVSYNLLSTIGFSSHISLAIAYLLLYGSVRAFLPNMFEWSMRHVPFMAGFLSLGVFVAIGALLFSVLPKFQDSSFGSISSLAPVASVRSISKLEEESEQQSHSVQINGKHIFERLKKIRSYLPSLFSSENGRSQILQALNDTSLESHRAIEQFKRLQSIHQAIQSEDIRSLQKLLRMKSNIPKQDLGKFTRYLRSSQERLNVEHSISSIDSQINSFMEKFQKIIDVAIYSVQRKDAAGTNKAIASAVRMESSLLRILEPAEQLEQKLKANFQRIVRKLDQPARKAA